MSVLRHSTAQLSGQVPGAASNREASSTPMGRLGGQMTQRGERLEL